MFPDKIAETATKATDRFYSIESRYIGTFGQLLKVGEEEEIDHFLIHSVATKPAQVSSINRFLKECVEQGNGKMTALGAFHPRTEDAAKDVEEARMLGFHGFKIHPDIQGFPVDDPGYRKLYELCRGQELTVLIHTGDWRYDNSNPNRLIPLLQEFPDVTFVGAHFGGWSIGKEAASRLCEFQNLYVDCSSSFYKLTDGEIRECIDMYGTDRVMFASDYPMWDAKSEADRLLSLHYSDDDYRKMFYDNAEKVYRL